jgi:hypothetical protein
MVGLADQKLSKFFYSKRFLFIVKKMRASGNAADAALQKLLQLIS